MGKKKDKKKLRSGEVPPITGHDCKAEIKSPSRGRFEKRESDQPDGVTGNYS